MDLPPGLFCVAHFAMLAYKEPETIGDYVVAGRAGQHFWLTATSLELSLQPELPLFICSRYVRKEKHFSQSIASWAQVQTLAGRLKKILADDTSSSVFLGRIGLGASPAARSLHLPLQRLTTAT